MIFDNPIGLRIAYALDWLDTRAWRKLVARFAAWRVGAWFIVNVLFRLDDVLLKRSRGRVALALGWNMLLLTTTGARSGKPRTTPLLYVADRKRIVLIASNGGRAKYPAWYWNLCACSEAIVLRKGRAERFVAHEAQGAERERLWNLAVDYFPGYAEYQERISTRHIPVMVLTPCANEDE